MKKFNKAEKIWIAAFAILMISIIVMIILSITNGTFANIFGISYREMYTMSFAWMKTVFGSIIGKIQIVLFAILIFTLIPLFDKDAEEN